MKLLSRLSKRSLVAFVALIVVFFAVSGASQPAQANRALPPAELTSDRAFIASLDPIEGLVQHQLLPVESTATLEWSTTNEVVLVSEGDRVRTDSNGFAYLTFFEGLETDIGPDTLVVVSTLEIPPAGEEGRFDVTLDVLVGNTFSNVETVLDEEDRFEIHTPGATAVVRGTKWFTLVLPNGDTIFSAQESTLFVFQYDGVGPNTPPPQLPDLIQLPPGFSLRVDSEGVAGEPYEGMDAQFGPQGGPLAPASCGNGMCETGEEGICEVDCLAPDALPQCGDAICDAEGGEGLLTCAEDCGPFEGAECGNGTCDGDESGLSCPADCQPDDYLSPVSDAWCGNGICDITESALTCLDCAAPADQGPDLGLLCVLTAQGEPVRSGPGETFPAAFILGAGQQLSATGVNQNGTWFAVTQAGQQLWVRAAGVTAQGACGGLPILTGPAPQPQTQPQPTVGPQPTFAPQVTPTSAGPGMWLPCGSCNTCGYPAEQCVTAPDGQCLWDPGTCGFGAQPTTAPEPTGQPRQPALTVPASSYSCDAGGSFPVTATYVQVDDATLSSVGASSSNPELVGLEWSDPSATQFEIFVFCGFPSTFSLAAQQPPSDSATVTAYATDTAARQVSTSFTVIVTGSPPR